jgi:peptidoglycan/LPS O-acetylase OafA/YrhL
VRRRPEHRTFLLVVIAMGLAIVGSYAFVPFWDGGWSFSQRYFTSLFPLLVLGVAAAIEERRRLGIALAAVCALWSIYLCLNLVTIGGPQYESTVSGGASDLAALPFRTHTSPGAYAWGVYHQSRVVKALVPWPFSH